MLKPRRFDLFKYPARILIFSFIIIITTGTILLMTPLATVGERLSFIDALFTATSATCVTGLIVVDTASKFTLFGQAVILILIQIGGLGIMTLSTFFVYLIAGRISMTEREIIQDTLSQHLISDLGRLLKSVFWVTMTIEAIGGILLTLKFVQTQALSKALFSALFHTVSAFCNAGFSVQSNSFLDYNADLYTNVVLMGLIILGGLGFIVIFDIFQNKRALLHLRFSKLSFHSRIVLLTSSILTFGGALVILGLEYDNSLQQVSLPTKLIASLFQSVTCRTAGFNTLEIGTLANSTLFFMALLMFVGASPGSCGGGIKTSTFAVLTASVLARFRLQEDVNIFYRRIPNATVSRAISIAIFSAVIVVLFTMVILITELHDRPHPESRGMFLEYMFEVVSAFGTVGLSTGVTAELSKLGRVLITILMFIGRLGPVTIALAVQGRETAPKFKYIRERVLVG